MAFQSDAFQTDAFQQAAPIPANVGGGGLGSAVWAGAPWASAPYAVGPIRRAARPWGAFPWASFQPVPVADEPPVTPATPVGGMVKRRRAIFTEWLREERPGTPPDADAPRATQDDAPKRAKRRQRALDAALWPDGKPAPVKLGLADLATVMGLAEAGAAAGAVSAMGRAAMAERAEIAAAWAALAAAEAAERDDEEAMVLLMELM